MVEKCANHPDKKALSFCHSCGKYFCDTCLIQGAEFYYCRDEQCMAAKSKDEAIISNKIEIDEKRAVSASASFKRTFFKDILLFLLLAFPLYLFASFLIADPRLKSLSVLSLMTLLSCGKAFVANGVIGFCFHKLFIKTDNRKKEFRRNSLVISTISFFVFFTSLEKIKYIAYTENVSFILSFAVSVMTFLVLNILFSLLIKKTSGKVT